MKLKAGQIVAERYEIEEFLGSGGMSVVYRANDTKLGRHVTLKVLREDYLQEENYFERFPKEARAAAVLNHSNIVKIYDHGQDGDILFIVLEYVDGENLKKLMGKQPLDDETTLGVAIQIAEGLAEAHANNIIHLDIKPQNILVTTTSIVKVADFGIARVSRNATLNAGSGSMGSVHYFSPEQARGGYIDHKSDIYSLGIVMYEMATGQLPYEGENEVAIALQHINDPLPDIWEINPNASESLVRIILKATEKSASKRYNTINDMIKDLKRALTDASGVFVQLEDDDKAPTRSISEENKEAVRKAKMRQAFLDGVEWVEETDDDNFELVSPRSNSLPKENRPANIEEYMEGQEYGENYELTDEYYEELSKPKLTSRDKKADKIAAMGGIIFGVIMAAGIGLFAWHLFTNVFSSTANMEAVPDVVGNTLSVADISIRAQRFIPIPEEDYCGDEFHCANENCMGECIGTILAQRVEAGTLRSPGDTVRIVVSLGIHEEEEIPEPEATPEPTPDPIQLGFVTVPSIIGLTEREAHNLLRENFLLWIRTGSEESDDFEAGQIISQEQEPNEIVEIDTRIRYIVSLGPAPEETPQPSPSPTPVPTATPEPTPETTPEPTPEITPEPEQTPVNIDETPVVTPDIGTALVMVDGVLNIYLPSSVPSELEQVRLLIQRVTPDGVEIPIVNSMVSVTEFNPYRPIPIQYSTPTIFRIFFLDENEMQVGFSMETR